MRKADTPNMERLKMCWPEIYHELERRYHAPGGLIDKECWTRKRKGEITLTWLVEPDASEGAEFDDGHDGGEKLAEDKPEEPKDIVLNYADEANEGNGPFNPSTDGHDD
jgi:hypothetical protein